MLPGLPLRRRAVPTHRKRRPISPTTEALTRAPHSPAVVAATVAQPAPVEASDGKVHLAYELLITNASGLRVRIEHIEARDAATKKTILIKSGGALQRDFTPVSGSRADEGTVDLSADLSTSTLAPSEVWVAWMDVSVPTRADVPARLDHRLVGALVPPGKAKPVPFDIGVANVEVSTQPPTVLSAPVKGGVWYMSEGCCHDDTHHRRGLAPINGQLMVLAALRDRLLQAR
jgi:hypothetical protein